MPFRDGEDLRVEVLGLFAEAQRAGRRVLARLASDSGLSRRSPTAHFAEVAEWTRARDTDARAARPRWQPERPVLVQKTGGGCPFSCGCKGLMEFRPGRGTPQRLCILRERERGGRGRAA